MNQSNTKKQQILLSVAVCRAHSLCGIEEHSIVVAKRLDTFKIWG